MTIKANIASKYRPGTYARAAIGLMRANNETNARGRHAIARAFVYAVLDLADAIRTTASSKEQRSGSGPVE